MENLDDNRLNELLVYCKLEDQKDDDEVKLLIPLFYSDAVSYLADAGVSMPETGSLRRAKYDLCVNFMVLDSWDHRDAHENGSVSDNPSFRRRINQLKLTEPVSNLGTF